MQIGAIVMAAGLGKRMRSKTAKVLHAVAGRPMLLYTVELAQRIANAGVVVVVGHQAADVKAVLDAHLAASGGDRPTVQRGKGLTAHVGRGAKPLALLVAEQTEQLGTGHAVMQARDVIRRARRHAADVYVILNGDTPLLREETVHALLDTHRRYKAGVTLLTANVEDPRGYGRIIRGDGNRVLRIVEDRDATKAEIAVKEINVGTYVVDGPCLFEALDKLQPENAQREYYLTDIVKFAVERRVPVAAHVVPDPDEGLGINSRQQLADAERIMRTKIVRQWLEAGVTMRDPNTTVIDADVQIGQDTVLHPFVTLEGRTRIGSDCAIRSQVRIVDSVLADRVVVQDGCLIEEARLDEESVVGPFAHLRPGSVLRRGAKV